MRKNLLENGDYGVKDTCWGPVKREGLDLGKPDR